MARASLETLTEQMFYILLCLHEECHGIEIMERIKNITEERIVVGPGTLYHLLDRFCKEKLITETRIDGRKRYYQIAEAGQSMLQEEMKRLRRQLHDYDQYLTKGERSHEE